MDQRYLNYENAPPIVSPLQKPLGIEMYNEMHFHPKPPKTTSTTADLPSDAIDKIAFTVHDERTTSTASPTITSIPDNINHETTRQTPIEQLLEPSYMSGIDLHNAVSTPTDKLFFVQYTPAGTMRPRWYLIQIDMISTAELNPQWAKTGRYFCVFLARHPTDKDKSDEFARWWPDWYRYETCKQSQEIIYGDRILFQPSVILNSAKYIQWAEELDLTQTAV